MNCSARILLGDLNRRSKWHCSLVLRSHFAGQYSQNNWLCGAWRVGLKTSASSGALQPFLLQLVW